ncbi:hypothetical protein [Halapricum desulfuricans]|uniref:Tape measure protein n=1 Tax=Halapricum desulfuricans TaxID=2841257 RepID=A0A897N7N9_9EURY|nr:hypothetical protein [Halapricum desulfuricans]QSG06406.1 hypothetical protein HSR121_2074 [Halapricum desulfuricans]
MANSDPVKVTVEIIDKFSDDLEKLERRLDKIDKKKLDVRLDIDDGRLEEIEARLKKLEEDINSTLKIDVRGYGAAKSKKKDLEKDMFSTLHIGVNKDRLRGLGNLSGGEGFNPPKKNLPQVDPRVASNVLATEGSSSQYASSLRRFEPEEREFINDWIINPDVARAHNRGISADDRDGWIGPKNWNFGIGEKWGPEPRYPGDKERSFGPGSDFLRQIGRATRSASKLEIGDNLFSDAKFGDVRLQARGFDPDLFAPDRGSGRYPWPLPKRMSRRIGELYGGTRVKARGAMRAARSPLGGLMGFLDSDPNTPMYNRKFGGITKLAKRLAPTDMKKWYRILAMLLPVLIALAGAAVGLVAAFGALATAGVALTGIGLLGWGDSTAESLNNVKRRLNELKKEIFGILRPVSALFQPFTAELFNQLPNMVENFVDPLKALVETGFDDWWLDSLNGVSEWFADLLWAASELAPEIQAIGTAFGQAFGTWLTKFLTRMTLELHDNWEMWSRLTRSFLAIINLIYELSKVLAFLIAGLEPLFILIGKLTSIIGNDLLVALTLAIAAMWALDFAMAAVAAKLGYATFAKMAAGIWAAATATGGLSGAMAILNGWLTGVVAKLATINVLSGGLLALTGLVVGYGAYSALQTKGTASDAVGGSGPSGSFSGNYGTRVGGQTTINIYGDVGNREYNKLVDNFGPLYREQRNIEDSRKR